MLKTDTACRLRTFHVSDTVTYERTWAVQARDEQDAVARALDEGPTADVSLNQIDNTPSEAVAIED